MRADMESAPTGAGKRVDMESAPTGAGKRVDMKSALISAVISGDINLTYGNLLSDMEYGPALC
jgi:hypothetical protein